MATVTVKTRGEHYAFLEFNKAHLEDPFSVRSLTAVGSHLLERKPTGNGRSRGTRRARRGIAKTPAILFVRSTVS